MRSLLVLLALVGSTIAAAEAAPKARRSNNSVPAETGLVDVPESKYRAGLQLGVGIPTNGDFGSGRLLAGADFYLTHDERYDFGLSYLTGGKRVEATKRRWRANFAGVEANLKMPSVSTGFYVGAAAGVSSFDGGDAYLPGIDDFYFGPKIGFLRMITREFSFGFEGKALFVTSSPFLAWLDGLASFHYHF